MFDWDWDDIDWYDVAKFATYASGIGLAIGTLCWPSTIGMLAAAGWCLAAWLWHRLELVTDDIIHMVTSQDAGKEDT
jgi:hypothetical protein